MGVTPLVPGDPQQLGAYWLAGRLGAGGQGVVYEAYDAGGKRVAVKALHGELVDERLRDMLAREVAAVQRVASFCTAQVLSAELEGSSPFIVSEFVAGPDLQKAVTDGGPYGPDELHRLAIGIATALATIHRAGVVHRDLKPANVLIGPDGPRVIDFGVARTEEMTQTRTGAKGTPRYMAPEVFQGHRAGTASDVWAWGASVLFAALGNPPFPGSSLPELMHSVLNLEPDIDALNEPLRSIVAAALHKDPAQRPASNQVLMSLVGGDVEQPSQLLAAGSRAAADVQAHNQKPEFSFADAAEVVFQRLDPEAQEAVPRVMLRMVMPGQGAEDTLRKAQPSEFTDDQAAQRVLEAFAAVGLLVRDEQSVAIVNAALLRAWPRLNAWADAERDGLTVHHSLSEAAQLWEGHGRKTSDLYQGTPLDRALQWAATARQHLGLNPLERAFLDAGAARTRQRIRLRGLLTAAMAVLMVVSLGTAVIAFDQRRNATRQRDTAVSHQVAAQSQILRRSDPRMARRYAIAAAQLHGDKQSREAVLNGVNQWEDDLFSPPGIARGNTTVSFSPDGRSVAALGPEGPRVWDAATHKQTRALPKTVLNNRNAEPAGIALSPDGRLAAGQRDWDNGQLFDLTTNQPVGPDLGPNLNRFRFSQSGNLLLADGGPFDLSPAVGGAKPPRAVLWDVRQKRALREWAKAPVDWAVSADDRLLAVALEGKRFELWDLVTGKRLPTPWLKVASLGLQVQKLTFSPQGRRLGLGYGYGPKTGRLALVDLTRNENHIKFLPEPPYAVPATAELGWPDQPVFSADGRFISVGFTLWDTSAALRPLMDYRLANQKPQDCRFSPDNRFLRCATDLGDVITVDITRYTNRAGHPHPTKLTWDETALSGNGDLLALGDEENIYLWDTRKKQLLPGRLPAAASTSGQAMPMRLSPDGRLLAISAEKPGGIEIWDTRAARKVRTLAPPSPDWREMVAPSFSPDGKSIAASVSDSTYKGTLQVWDVGSGRPTRTLPVKIGAEPSFRADGRAVALPSAGLLEISTGRVLAKPIPYLTGIKALSPDGKTLLGATEREIGFWDVTSGQRTSSTLTTLADQYRKDISTAAKFSPDGTLVATGDKLGTVRLWDTETKRQFGLNLIGHTAEVRSLSFSPDGKTLTSASVDGTVRTHPIDPERAVTDLCAKVGQLTEADWKQHIKDAPYRETCP